MLLVVISRVINWSMEVTPLACHTTATETSLLVLPMGMKRLGSYFAVCGLKTGSME